MKFKLQGRTYEAAAVDRLTLGDLMRLEQETTQMGRPMKWSELREIVEHFDELLQTAESDDALEQDDLWPWFMGILIWSTRRSAGDAVTFAEAVDIHLDEIEMIEDKVKKPQDRKPKKAGGASDPRRARAASARAGAHAAGPVVQPVSQ